MANQCLIYEDKWENIIWKDEYQFLKNEKEKQNQIVNLLETDINNDLKFTRIIDLMFDDFRIDLDNDIFYSRLFNLCIKFREFNSIKRPYDKSIFVEIRKTIINKERKRLKFLEIELEKFKQICPLETTSNDIKNLEKEEILLIRERFFKNRKLKNLNKLYLFKLFLRMNLLNEWKEFLIRDFYYAMFKDDKQIDMRIEFIGNKIVQLNNGSKIYHIRVNRQKFLSNRFKNNDQLVNQIDKLDQLSKSDGELVNESDQLSESDGELVNESDQLSESDGELVNESDQLSVSNGELANESDQLSVSDQLSESDSELSESNYQSATDEELNDKNDIIQSNNLSPNTIKRLIGMDLIDLIDEDDDNNEYELDSNLSKIIKKVNTTKDSSDIDLDEFDQINLDEIEEIENILKNTKPE